MNGRRSTLTPEQRAMHARQAAYARWGRTPLEQRRKATAPARAGLMTRWEREVDPDGTLPLAERAVLAESVKRAHMVRMALASSRARSKRTA